MQVRNLASAGLLKLFHAHFLTAKVNDLWFTAGFLFVISVLPRNSHVAR